MFRKRITTLLAIFGLATTAAYGCNGISTVGNGGNTEGTGTVRVELTDAPTLEFDHVYVTVASVLVHYKDTVDDASDDTTDETDDDVTDVTAPVDGTAITENAKKSGWLVVAQPNREFDLLTLQNDVTALLGSEDLPAGEYKNLRLVLTAARVVTGETDVTAGTEYPLKVPSGETSGLKIKTKFTVEADHSHTLVLDFDAALSIHQTGNGKYILKPVLKVKSFKDNGAKSDDDDDDDDKKDKGKE